MEFLENLEFFHVFFFFEFWSKKKLFWTEKGPILAEKQVSKIFFSRPIWGAKNFPHLYLTNFAAAIAAVTTKLTLIEVPYEGLISEDELIQGPWLRQGSLLAWTPSQGSWSGWMARGAGGGHAHLPY